MRKNHFLTKVKAACLWGMAALTLPLATACSSDTQDGDPGYLARDMFIVEVEEGVNVFFQNNGDGTVLVSYDLTNPMHMTEKGAYVLTDYVGEINIPATITVEGTTYRVVGVKECAFMNNTTLTKVTLPAGISSIGTMAFKNCPLLEEVNIPEGVGEIPDYCFQDCKALKVIDMPGHMNSIGDYAFKNCKALEGIRIPEGVTELSDELFSGLSAMTAITLPKSLERIGVRTFYGCNKITVFQLPDGVTALADSAFLNCSALKYVGMPEKLESLGVGTFAGCRSLIEVTLPESVKTIGENCFSSFDSKTGDSNWNKLTLNVMSTVPPTLTGSITNAKTRKRLVIPRGYLEAYEANPYWAEFDEILERNY